jgi:hypothetical protein
MVSNDHIYVMKLLLHHLFLDCPSTLAYRAYLYSALHGIEVYGAQLNSLVMETNMPAAAEIVHGASYTCWPPGSTQSGHFSAAELNPSGIANSIIEGSSLNQFK